jgi:hypothetical protein
MPDEAIQTTESSPVVTEPQSNNEAVTIPTDSREYAEWRATGKLPEPKKAPEEKTGESKNEESATSDAPKEEKSEGKKPKTESAAETGKETEQESHKKGAEARIRQLLAKIKELESKSETPKPDKTEKAESSPAKDEEKKDTPKDQPKDKTEKTKRPKLEDFENWDDWQKADSDWVQEQIDAKAKKLAEEALTEWESKQTKREQQRELQKKIDSARERYPDLDEGFVPAVEAIFDDKSIAPVIKAAIQESDVDIDLLYVMGKDADDLADFVATAKTKPREALRRVFEVERLVKEELAKGKAGKTEVVRGSDGKFTSNEANEPPAKTKTKAPPPGYEPSGRVSPPGDVDEAALKALESGDVHAFRRFREDRNSRDLGKSHR